MVLATSFLLTRTFLVKKKQTKSFLLKEKATKDYDYDRNFHRKKLLEEQCQKYRSKTNHKKATKIENLSPFNKDQLRLVWTKNLKIIACTPPKTGTTSWQTIFLKIMNDTKNFNYNTLPRLKNIRDLGRLGEIEKIIFDRPTMKMKETTEHKTEITMVNTRHPFIRLFSCWGDKLNKFEN